MERTIDSYVDHDPDIVTVSAESAIPRAAVYIHRIEIRTGSNIRLDWRQ